MAADHAVQDFSAIQVTSVPNSGTIQVMTQTKIDRALAGVRLAQRDYLTHGGTLEANLVVAASNTARAAGATEAQLAKAIADVMADVAAEAAGR